MKKILISGASGLLGCGLLKTRPKNLELILASLEKRLIFSDSKLKSINFDITSNQKVLKSILAVRPEIIVHAASQGNVDLCEKEKKKAWQINVKGTKNILAAAKKVKAKIIFVSSNAVFDGQKAPYAEKNKPHPINFYGKTKYQGELLIQKSSLPFLIVRLITMYGWHLSGSRENPVTWLLSRLINKEKVKLVDDVYFNPLYNIDAASALWKLIKKNRVGIYHIAGPERTNRFDWGILTAKIFGLSPRLISPVPNAFFKNIAPRPFDTTYSIAKIKKDIGFKPKNLKVGLIHTREHPF